MITETPSEKFLYDEILATVVGYSLLFKSSKVSYNNASSAPDLKQIPTAKRNSANATVKKLFAKANVVIPINLINVPNTKEFFRPMRSAKNPVGISRQATLIAKIDCAIKICVFDRPIFLK